MPVRSDQGDGETESSLEFVKRGFEYRRGVRPYICSTGADFKAEHEALRDKVFPELHRLARTRGAFFTPTEMQWNSQHPQTQRGQMLLTALGFIERCSPFLIGLLGERYGPRRGWGLAPLRAEDSGKSWIDRNLLIAAQSGHTWLLDESTQKQSLVEIQIQYASFKNTHRKQGIFEDVENQYYFYFRQPEYKDSLFMDCTDEEERAHHLRAYEPEDDSANTCCRALKAEIIKRGHVVRYFRSIPELCAHVMRDWQSVLDHFCPPIYGSLNITNEQAKTGAYRLERSLYLDWLNHEDFAAHKRDSSKWLPEWEDLAGTLTQWALTALDEPQQVARPQVSGHLRAVAHASRGSQDGDDGANRYQSVIAIVGDRGSGKSCFIAHWWKELERYCGSFLARCVHHVESDASASSVRHMLRRIAAYLSNQLEYNQVKIDEECQRETSLAGSGELFRAALSHKPCLVVIDGLDDLGKHNSDAQVRELNWLLSPLPPHVRVVVTTCRSDVSYTALSKRADTKVINLPMLTSVETQKSVLRSHFGLAHACMSERQVRFLLEHCRLQDRALFLQLTAHYAAHPDNAHRIEELIEQVLEKASVRDLLQLLLQHWINLYSWPATHTPHTPKSTRGTPKPGPARESGGWVADVLRLLLLSRRGMSSKDLLELLIQLGFHGNTRVTHYDLQLLLGQLEGVILYQAADGRYRFNHQHILEGIQHALLSPLTIEVTRDVSSASVVVPRRTSSGAQARRQPDKKIYHAHLADFFSLQQHSARRTYELPWQVYASGDMHRLYAVLTEPRLFLSMMEDQVLQSELCNFWSALQDSHYDPATAYTELMALVLHGGNESDFCATPDREPGTLSPLFTSTAREATTVAAPDESTTCDEHCHVKVYELGRNVADLLVLFECYPEALQIALTAYNQLMQICPLELAEEQCKAKLEARLGACYTALESRKDAIRWYERALGTLEDLLTTSTVPRLSKHLTADKGDVLTSLATLHLAKGESRVAEDLLAQARKCASSSDNLIGEAHASLQYGRLKAWEQDYFKAHVALQKAQQQYEKWFGRSHHQVADVLHEFAVLLSNENNTYRTDERQAESLFRRALSLREQAFGPSHLKVADTLFYFGELLKKSKNNRNRSEALTLLQRAYDIHNTKLGPEHSSSRRLYQTQNDLELSLNFRPQYRLETRCSELPFSTLSWHESQLNDLEMRARRKQAFANMTKVRVSLKAVSVFKGLAAKAKLTVAGANKTGGMVKARIGSGTDKSNTLVSSLGVLVPKSDSNTDVKVKSKEDVGLQKEDEVLDTIQEAEDIEDLESNSELIATETSVNTKENHKEPVANGAQAHQLKSQSEVLISKEINPTMSRQSSAPIQRPSSSKRDIIRIPTDKSAIQTNDMSVQYLDSYCSLPSNKSVNGTSTVVKKVLRPQSAPYRMLQKYESLSRNTSRASSAVPRHASRPNVHSAPTSSSGRGSHHRRRCPPHEAQALNSANTVSAVNGPHTSTEILLGPKGRVPITPPLHMSAWYHVPGRYSTPEVPYPPKRSQNRVSDAHRKLVRNLHFRSQYSQLLLTSVYPTYMSPKPEYLNP